MKNIFFAFLFSKKNQLEIMPKVMLDIIVKSIAVKNHCDSHKKF